MVGTLGITIPCGYGPPGSLPQPLPGGLDGGDIGIPTQPPGGGPGIIITPGGPGIPITPGPVEPNTQPPVILVNDIIDVQDDEVTIICTGDVPVEVSGKCTGPNTVDIFLPGVYLKDHILNFTGLIPESAYTYSLVCRESSIAHLATTVGGSFTTLAAPVIGIPPVITSNNVLSVTNNTATIFCAADVPVEVSAVCTGPNSVTVFSPGVFLKSWVLVFTGLLQESLYTYTLTCKEGVNNLTTVVGGSFTTLSNNNNPNGNFEEAVEQPLENQTSIYSKFLEYTTKTTDSLVDLKYTQYGITPTGFKPALSTNSPRVFNPIKHRSIDNVLNSNTTTFEVANLDKENITPQDIKLSLRPTIREAVSNIKYANGIKVPESVILKSIKQHVLNNTIDNVDVEYFAQIASKPEVKRSNSVSIPRKANYGSNIQDVKSSRAITVNPTSIVETQANITTGLDLLKRNIQSIDPSKYADDSREYLRLWYTIPSDVNKRLEYTTSDGTVVSYYINNDESFHYETSVGTSALDYLDVHDSVNIELAGGTLTDYYSKSDISRAAVLRNIDELEIKYNFGIVDDTILEVSAADTNIEYTDENNDLDTHYILMLDPLSLIQSYNENLPYIIETKATYVLKSKSASDVSTINDSIIFNAYPWKVLCIDFNDPILDYFSLSDSGNNTFTVTFKDVTYNKLGAKYDPTLPLLVRKIPKFITIIPTDKTKYNLFNGESQLVDWNTRLIRFEKSPDKEFTNTGINSNVFKVENSFLTSQGESKSGDFSTQAYMCTYSPTEANFGMAFDGKRATRLKTGIRAALQAVSDLESSYVIDNGLTLYDVLSRLDRSQLYSLDTTVTKSILNKLESGDKTDVILFHIPGPKINNIDARRLSTRLISVKEGSAEIPNNYVDFDIPDSVSQVEQAFGGSILSV